ncbi:nitroreductase family protein [Elizabethkingia anophelis]|nr:nitroreductase family protein [Elizabethkingia anophelis]MCT4063409.1 nitroreductase family protein [Elizabethkingia anophelis]MCT4109701.1 nitroreductase family protein [Elizabethkingia anophelis]
MSYTENIKKRYTTKKYKSNVKIEEGKIEKLKEILRLTPSSINSQPWKFIFISDQNIKESLAQVSYMNKSKILDCSHIIVLTVDTDIIAFEKEIKETLPTPAIEFYYNFVKSKGENFIHNWLSNQVYISLGFLLSATANLEIDSSPMEGIQKDQYDKILNNERYKTLVAIAIGQRAEDDFNQLALKPKSRKSKDETVVNI